MAYYNRGGAEVEQFRNDKSGLNLAARRKRGFLAQKGLHSSHRSGSQSVGRFPPPRLGGLAV